jgi:lysophospholipase L1-like esterase
VVDTRIRILTPEALKPWAGKTIYLLGDSISSTDYPWYGPMLAAKTGATVIVGGYSGATVAAIATTARLNTVVAANPDLVVIMTSGNDQGTSGTVGTLGNAVGETVKADPDITSAYSGGSYIEACAYIVRYLSAQLYLSGTKVLYLNGLPQNRLSHDLTTGFNNPLNHQRKAAAVREVCERYHVGHLDTLTSCGWDVFLEPFWPGVTDKNTNYGTYTMDGLHPNQNGYERLTDAIAGAVNASMKPMRLTVSVPTQVTNLVKSNVTTSGVSLTWNAASRAASYVVEYRASAGIWQTLTTTMLTSAATAALSPSTSYEFRVYARNVGGNGPVSAVVSATTLDPTPIPGQVTGLAKSDASNSSVSLTWTAVSGAASYKVESKLASSSTWTSTTTTTNAAKVTGLLESTSYNFRVSGVNESGTGPTSSVLTESTVAFAPIADDFTRADNATTLGSTPDGRSWEVLSPGSVFGISSNAARRYAVGSNIESVVAVDAGRSDVDVSVTLAVVGSGGGGPIFRATDEGNYWLIDFNASGAKLYKRVNNVFSLMGTVSSANPLVAGTVARIVASGSTISASINGGTATVVTDSFNQSATKHGIRISGSTATVLAFDTFRVS